MRLKKIIISFCLITMIAFNQTYDVYADAGSLVVAGGAIGVAGVGVAGLTGPVVVAVFLGLMAFGMNVELTKASEQAGMTKTQFVKSKLEQYCQEANIAQSTFGSYVLEQAEIFNDGRIKLSDKAAQMIKRFGNWLFENDMVNDNTSSGNPDGMINIGNAQIKPVNIGDTISLGVTTNNQNITLKLEQYSASYPSISDVGACIVTDSGYNTLVFVSKIGTNHVTFARYINNALSGTVGRAIDKQKNGLYYYDLTWSQLRNANLYDNLPVYDMTLNQFLNGIDGTFDNVAGEAADDSFTGSRDDWASGNPALDPAQDQSLVVNPDLINSIPIPADKDLTWDVNSYLDALEKALDKVANPDVPAVDDATGLPVSIPIPDTITLDPTADRVDNPDLPQQKTPIIDPNKEPEGEQAVDPLKFDLKNIFPFCLPWDIKDMLNLLKANPQAPSYHVDWHIPIINTDLEFTVDLSPFNSVASVARKMELLAFVIGLAVITRRLIRG